MMRPATILFLAANPIDRAPLALDREARKIDQRLRAASYHDAFRVEQAWAVRAADLQACLLRFRPAIIHFGGHGSPTGHLLLENKEGSAEPVSTAAIAGLCRITSRQTRCVVLNACYSEVQAKAIAEHVDCVVGMTRTICDDMAIAFAGSFYQALGYGEDIQTAFDLGCNQVAMLGLPDADAPKLLVRCGVQARECRFIGEGLRARR